jgi:hypothetical protein
MNPPTTRDVRAMAIGSNRPTKGLRPYEKQSRSLQNKEDATRYHLETVRKSMEKSATRSKRNGHLPRQDTGPCGRSRRFPPRRESVRTTSRREQGRRIPKRTRPKGRTKESPHMLLLREARSLRTGLSTETQQSGAKRTPSKQSSTHACSTDPTGRKQHTSRRR